MMLELVAGRMVSRNLGASLYTWTSVIGVVLAGIAAGNYAGGLLADRRKAAPSLSALFVLASLASVLVCAVERHVGEWAFLWMLPWPARVALHVTIVFLPPSLLLGTIGPVATKMALDRGAETGRTIGGVYAWGVAGSLAGTFAAGFWLIAALGTAAVVWAVAAALAAAGLLLCAASFAARAWIALLVPLAAAGLAPWDWAEAMGARLSLREPANPQLIYSDESQYSHIRVYRVSESPDVRNLHLDKLLHSSVVMGSPDELRYGYGRIYASITTELAGARDSLATLTIGGGGYMVPRWIGSHWPKGRTDVVEIDPAVTRAAVLALGLPAEPAFGIWHEDGRAYVRRLAEARRGPEPPPSYDFIYLDAVNDYSVPYQLTTREFALDVRELLSADGAFLMNLIDAYDPGLFLGAVILTLQSVFPEVEVFAEGAPPASQPTARNTYVVAAAQRPFDAAKIAATYDRRIGLQCLSAGEKAALMGRRGARPLTDDWSPVENLLAPVVRRASRDMASSLLATRAQRRLVDGDLAGAERDAESAVRLRPDSEEAHRELAAVRLREGDVAGAVAAQREVVRVAPGSARDWHRLGVMLADSGHLDEAVPAYERARELAPADLEVLNDLGVALARAGRLEEAVARFEQVLRSDAAHLEAGQNLESARKLLARRAAP
jgi:spermidine synthase/Flp pilus assembly protein TadD